MAAPLPLTKNREVTYSGFLRQDGKWSMSIALGKWTRLFRTEFKWAKEKWIGQIHYKGKNLYDQVVCLLWAAKSDTEHFKASITVEPKPPYQFLSLDIQPEKTKEVVEYLFGVMFRKVKRECSPGLMDVTKQFFQNGQKATPEFIQYRIPEDLAEEATIEYPNKQITTSNKYEVASCSHALTEENLKKHNEQVAPKRKHKDLSESSKSVVIVEPMKSNYPSSTSSSSGISTHAKAETPTQAETPKKCPGAPKKKSKVDRQYELVCEKQALSNKVTELQRKLSYVKKSQMEFRRKFEKERKKSENLKKLLNAWNAEISDVYSSFTDAMEEQDRMVKDMDTDSDGITLPDSPDVDSDE